MADKPGFGLYHKSFFSWLSIQELSAAIRSTWRWHRHFVSWLFCCFVCGWKRTWFFWILWLDSQSLYSLNPKYSSLSPSQHFYTSVFLDEFSTYLENVIMCPEPLMIAGDFNFHLDLMHSNNSRRFKELLQTFCLSQDVTASTRSWTTTQEIRPWVNL